MAVALALLAEQSLPTLLVVYGSNPISNINKIIFYLSNCNVEKTKIKEKGQSVHHFLVLCTIIIVAVELQSPPPH